YHSMSTGRRNGLACQGRTARGRGFSGTKEREIVWEYISPCLWDSSVPAIRNLVYRAYRVPYGWGPQLPKPKESAVDPGSNYMRVTPAKDGSKPDFGVGKTSIWKK
ncbi:MAG: hypothetical protein JXA73_15055, partial [Acidobacteria bacterium]|nr:hypothetical protein [Acidobacteriota bacterium]